MSFLAVRIGCATVAQTPIEQQHTVTLLSCEEKATLITDIAIASIVALLAIGIILSNQGINLGPLNALSMFSSQTAYIMIGAAGGVLLLDLFSLMVKMASHISRLFELNHTLAESADTTNYRTLLAEKERWTEELDNEAAQSAALKGRVRELDEELALVKEDLVEATTAKATLKAQLDAAAMAKPTLAPASAPDPEALRKQNEELEAAKRAKAQLVGEIAPLKGEKAQLETDLPPLRSEKGDLETALPGLRTEKGNLDTALPSLRTEKGDLEAALPGLRTEKGNLDTALPSLRTEKGDLEAALPGLRTEKGNLDKELPVLRTEKGGLEAALPALRTENGNLDRELPRLRQAKVDVEDEVTEIKRKAGEDEKEAKRKEDAAAQRLADLVQQIGEKEAALKAAPAGPAPAPTPALGTASPWIGENGKRYKEAIEFEFLGLKYDLLKFSFELIKDDVKKQAMETVTGQTDDQLRALHGEIKQKATAAQAIKDEAAQLGEIQQLAGLTTTFKEHLQKLVAAHAAGTNHISRMSRFFDK